MSLAEEFNHLPTWKSQDAKAEFSRLVRESSNQDQLITNREEPVAVVISKKRYDELTKKADSLLDFFRNANLNGKIPLVESRLLDAEFSLIEEFEKRNNFEAAMKKAEDLLDRFPDKKKVLQTKERLLEPYLEFKLAIVRQLEKSQGVEAALLDIKGLYKKYKGEKRISREIVRLSKLLLINKIENVKCSIVY